ncbi:hypothetical protein ARAM_004342 [Aspergillus rambellii]|uniref:Uncharacterized protein n=1 Tax=Aspergillus rambellii TaxID=308745 RepID=A0A0F8UQE1_9EURO|nr:hypothetical protein ARAM_004342 [Aspergillus rambellii]
MAIHSIERAIAHELVIELLAHQFAFPVQWIETQETLLRHIRRLVELGPSKTLLGMSQKTIAPNPRQPIQLLACTQDLQQLCYVYDDPEESTVDDPVIGTPVSSTLAEVTAPEPEAEPVPAVQVQEAPLTAIVIIRALIARKFRKSAAEIDTTQSIKDLCGGKSTLQNELVGELGNEFPTLPDRPEDVPLGDLDTALGEVSLGQVSSALLQRVFSAKMPARMTVATVRARLATMWGLPTHRQTAVLVGALAAEPQVRLPSLEAATQYWDGLTEAYAQSVGLSLQRQTVQRSRRPQLTPGDDDDILALKDSLGAKSLARKQYEALRQYLGISNSNTETDGLTVELQQRLDSWTAEFSDEFLSRITPCFDAHRARQYRDWWNAARQELLAVCELGAEAVFTEQLRDVLCRRSDRSLVRVAQANPAARILAPALVAALDSPPRVRLGESLTMAPQTVVSRTGVIEYHEHPRDPSRFAEFFTHWIQKNRNPGAAQSNGTDLTTQMLESLAHASQTGVTFVNKTYLITGAGPGSIGGHIARLLLAGGACVIVTTSREPSVAAPHFKKLYDELDLDAILPFAATGQVGAEIDGLDAGNEVALRLMLVNVLRLLGFIVTQKRQRAIHCRPTQVVLPLSPNHGILGGDGLYAESKRGLETVMRRFHSESWEEELSICGVNIGWTRSTSLMTTNDMVAETAEQQGKVLTFSGPEMAELITLLLSPAWATHCEDAPVMADFSGALGDWQNAAAGLAAARASIQQRAEIARAIAQEDERESSGRLGTTKAQDLVPIRASLRLGFPRLPEYMSEVEPLQHQLMPDLVPEDAVVVVGFAELGPWGSARVRWEMESRGQLSLAGHVEMAWLMNLIRHADGPGPNGHYIGWVDAQSGQPVADAEIPQQYGDTIRTHAGIRPLPSDNREIFQEIVLDEDLAAFETTRANAEALLQRHGSNLVTILSSGDGDDDDPSSTCQVQLRHGATIRVPKSSMAGPGVAGQLPMGWSPDKYGIPAEIVQQVDPVTLVLLCCVAETFYSAGITDPMEIFEHIHLSELGNFIGSSMGGVVNTRALYHDVSLDQDVPSDALQETYLNTAPAWVNMLLLGAAGPIKTPVGACATALESIDSALESIQAGHTKICLVGGYDDLQPEESVGFARMKATASVPNEQARGRLPTEMSRPTAASRAGFVESQGCGVQLLCRGDVALAMGLPIYGIVAGSGMAADGVSRSVPAPGHGILTFARENSKSSPAPLRAALARWGLGIDDLTVASLHATSTPANDKNEPAVIQSEMAHLGRTPGRPLWAICQKSVTGHPKAPAAAWMLNGCLQVLDSGLVPGNRNADDIEPELRAFDHLCFPTRPVQTAGVRAFLLNSCGFGQKEAQVVGVHPRYFFALQSGPEFHAYQIRVQRRTRHAERAYIRALMGNHIVQVQSRPPYEGTDMDSILLNPSARLHREQATGSYHVSVPAASSAPTRASPNAASGSVPPLRPVSAPDAHPSTVGVDTVTLSTFTAHENLIFLRRNYTDREYQSLQTHRDMRAAVASGWCAKEAVFKCLKTVSKGAGSAMKEIEILRSQGAPYVVLHGDALQAAQEAGLQNIQLSLSYADDSVIAIALGVPQ